MAVARVTARASSVKTPTSRAARVAGARRGVLLAGALAAAARRPRLARAEDAEPVAEPAAVVAINTGLSTDVYEAMTRTGASKPPPSSQGGGGIVDYLPALLGPAAVFGGAFVLKIGPFSEGGGERE